MSSNKWIATKRFPLTEAMRKALPSPVKVHTPPQIVSKQLCGKLAIMPVLPCTSWRETDATFFL